MTKRTRDEFEVLAQLTTKPEIVCSAIVDTARGWRDACGCLYDIDSKMYVSKEQIVLKVGFFDELRCEQIVAMANHRLPGDYVIQTFGCDLAKQLVEFTIAKMAKAAREESRKPAAVDAAELHRLRVTYELRHDDAVKIYEALDLLVSAFNNKTCSLKITRLAHRPSIIVLYIGISSPNVPGAAIRVAKDYCGVVLFEDKQIVLSVNKSQPDIL